MSDAQFDVVWLLLGDCFSVGSTIRERIRSGGYNSLEEFERLQRENEWDELMQIQGIRHGRLCHIRAHCQAKMAAGGIDKGDMNRGDVETITGRVEELVQRDLDDDLDAEPLISAD